jgi:hypothetical protein
VLELAELGAAIDEEAELLSLAERTSNELSDRLLTGLDGDERVEARQAVNMLLVIEWSAALGDEAEFRRPEFKREIVIAAIVGLIRSVGGRPAAAQLRSLRCDLLDSNAAELRREAFAAARDLFEQRIGAESATGIGAGLRTRLDAIDARSKELAGACGETTAAGVALANAWIDSGFLFSGDPCGQLTWDLYMLILGNDEQLPEAERVLGPDCVPNVLVFH